MKKFLCLLLAAALVCGTIMSAKLPVLAEEPNTPETTQEPPVEEEPTAPSTEETQPPELPQTGDGYTDERG